MLELGIRRHLEARDFAPHWVDASKAFLTVPSLPDASPLVLARFVEILSAREIVGWSGVSIVKADLPSAGDGVEYR